MNAIHRFLALFRNSPTYGRDQATLISGFTIGCTALLLNGSILLLLLPLLQPNGPEVRTLTENMEFGQVLALILTGGATALATLLIPVRMAGVLTGPRLGRYFDQIVLSGISPFRFLIGKVTSQNLFMALILFLLLPWFVLVLALGGLQWPVFLASLVLLWLYCMMIALVMLWLSLYENEGVALLLLLPLAVGMCAAGGAPVPYQPFIFSPFPALVHGVYAASGAIEGEYLRSYFSTFVSCAVGMSSVIGVSLVAIAIGPLYGVIRENSAFGEVVRAGDSKRKRAFRLRPHIQRPSEIAFFYENRGDRLRSFEGLLRWGSGFLGLLLFSGVFWGILTTLIGLAYPAWMAGGNLWSFYSQLTGSCHVLHGITLAVAILLFSHARNTTLLRVPVIFGWKADVSKLDSICFTLVLLISSALVIGYPGWFAAHVAGSAVTETTSTVSSVDFRIEGLNFADVAWKGTLVLNLAAVTCYLLQRVVCLSTWMKSASLLNVSVLYGALVCGVPVAVGSAVRSFHELQQYPLLFDNAPRLAMVSPAAVLAIMYGERSPYFGTETSPVPFLVVHGLIIVICLFAMRRTSRRLRLEYATGSATENR